MGFDLDRSEAGAWSAASDSTAPDMQIPFEVPPEQSVFGRALSRNLIAERFAIDAYRKIAAQGENYDKATLRLVRVALAVEEEHAEILSALIDNLRNLNGALAG
jgi:bacterioferritin (cytochrome b1)